MGRSIKSTILSVACVICSWIICSGHDTIPYRIWPLTNETRNKEVIERTADATITNGVFVSGEEELGYPAYRLDSSSSIVIPANDFRLDKFTLSAFIEFDPNLSSMIFLYKDSTDIMVFCLYVNNCKVYFKGLQTVEEEIKSDVCYPGWYNIGIRRKLGENKFAIHVVRAYPASEDFKNKAVADFEAKEVINKEEQLPENGTLSIGAVGSLGSGIPVYVDGAVCCVRLYHDEVATGHAEDQMKEDCERWPYWDVAVPAPTFTPVVNPCAGNPCQNGGTCQDIDRNYTCCCTPWYTDQNCSTRLGIADQSFKLQLHGFVRATTTPITGGQNVTTRNLRLCSALCLECNRCLSFTVTNDPSSDKKLLLCTLYDHIASDLTPDTNSKYYVAKGNECLN